jgi:hypothetical protein
MLFTKKLDADAPENSAAKTRNWKRRAGVVALSAALLGGGVPAATAGASTVDAAHAKSPASAKALVRLGQLNALANEDLGPDGDEPYITVNGTRVWDAPGSLDDGDSLPVNFVVNEGDEVSLFDADGPLDADDLLGTQIVNGTSGTLEFTNDGAHYTLAYGPA